MTRCAVGDLAYVCRCGNRENLGRIVEVMQPTTLASAPSEAAWVIRSMSAEPFTLYSLADGRHTWMEAKCPDAWLIPLRDLPGPDETITWAGAPGQMRAHALGGST